MTAISVTSARKKLYSLADEVLEGGEPVTLTSKRGNVVMISECDWVNIQETLYLSSIPGMKESLTKAQQDFSNNDSCKDLDW